MKCLTADGKGNIGITEVDQPRINDYQALVKIVTCGVCTGTDNKIIHAKLKGFTSYPCILGHEAIGRVVEVGTQVSQYQVGDLVMRPLLFEPTSGLTPAFGGFSEYAVVGDWPALKQNCPQKEMPAYAERYNRQLRLDPGLNPVGAVMIITLQEVLCGIRNFGFKANQSLVVYGTGPVGMAFIRFAKLLGMHPVVSVDIDDDKKALAAKMGADFAFNSRKEDISAACRQICPNGFDNIVDAAGVSQLINQAMQLVKSDGKICVYGIAKETKMEIDWSQAPHNWQLQFSQWPDIYLEAGTHAQILSWIKLEAIDPMDFISHVFDAAQIRQAIEVSQTGQAQKVVVQYE